MDSIEEQMRLAEEKNMKIQDSWDLDFFSKFKEIRVTGSNGVQFVVLEDTLRRPIETSLMFQIFVCSTRASPDTHYFTLIDTAIFDGLMTPRIWKGLSLLVERAPRYGFEWVRIRPTFKDEMRDISIVLYGTSSSRSHKFAAIEGYYMFPSPLDGSSAYIEWTIVRNAFQLTNSSENIPL